MQICIKDLSFSYGEKQIFNHLNLSIRQGERVWLSAPSGFGKTTLLRLILALEQPNGGEIVIKDKAEISVVFQEDRLLPWLSVYQNIELVLKHLPKDKRKEIAEEVLGVVGLKEESNKLPAALSGGMSRRVALARAFAKGGDILILDEPFVGIDEDMRAKIADYINLKYAGKTIILISHDAEEAALISAERLNLAERSF